MSWVALAGVAVLLGTLAAVGCGAPQQTCQQDTDCGPAARCDTEAKVCLQRREDTSCTSACAEWQFCSEQMCYPRYGSISILEPAPGVVDGGATVRAQLQTVASWIDLKPHAKLGFKVNDGTTDVNTGDLMPVGDAGIYSGHISVDAGSYTLVAGFPGFSTGAPVSAPVAITVDTTVPAFTVIPDPKTGLRTGGPGVPDDHDPASGFSNAFKRNDLVSVTIGSTASDLDLTSVALAVNGLTTNVPTTFQVSSSTGCGQAHCFTATADLSKVEMLALRGQMTIVATGRDMAGNEGKGTAQIPVTRFKWSRAMSGVTSIQASPAIGANGTVYVGTTSGSLSAIKPDGTNQWAAPVSLGGAFLASPAVGKGDGNEEVVYANPNVNPPILYAFFGSDGGLAMGPVAPPTTGGVAATPLVALTRVSGSDIRESATTFANGSPDFSLMSLRYGSPSEKVGLGDGGTVGSPGNIVGEDNLAFAADSTQRIHQYSFSAIGWSESVPLRATTGISVGLALNSTLVAGSTANTIFAFPRSGGSGFTQPETAPSIPSFIGTDLVYSEGSSFRAIRLTPTGAGPVTPNATGNLGVSTTTPLVSSGGTIYFQGTDNSLHTLNSNLSALWSGVVEGGGVTVASSPNIDCARAADGTKTPGPGTLYYGANNGKLYAIIVDNPGIDTTSPWPKYQHDPRNTGSLSTPLSEFACP